MNSRDAAFDESLKELIEATAAEAAAADPPKPGVNGCTSGQSEVADDDSNGRKKRKRGEDDACVQPATPRSDYSSSCSAVSPRSVPDRRRARRMVLMQSPALCPKSYHRLRNALQVGDRDIHAIDEVVHARPSLRTTTLSFLLRVTKVCVRANSIIKWAAYPRDVEPGTGPSKRSTQMTRGKAGPTPKRPPPSSHTPGSGTQDSSSKRNHSGTGAAAGSAAENSRAYRNSHAYAISQQPLFTSWNLPDYLAHLEHMLPTDIPRPLEVRSLAIGPGGRESLERSMERGVKVKWPSKRMSVGDMNKRVRALVEWVGREQASALDRGRRREALERALKSSTSGTGNILSDSPVPNDRDAGGGHREGRGSPMVVDNRADNTADPHAGELAPLKPASFDATAQQSTMRMMEELMEELINFQERFGPGVKGRERERRPAS